MSVKECMSQFTNLESKSFLHVIAKTILGSILASDGLINDSLTSLIPSMLISPIGSLLIKTAITIIELFYNPKIHIKQSFKMIFNFLVIILITIGIGFIYGYLYNKYKPQKLPSKEMKSRSTSKGLIETTILVLECAYAFPWASKNNDITTLISIGIATALLPPLVNIGLVDGSYRSNPSTYENKNILSASKKYGLIIFAINAIGLTFGSIIYFIYYCKNKR